MANTSCPPSSGFVLPLPPLPAFETVVRLLLMLVDWDLIGLSLFHVWFGERRYSLV